MKIVKILGIFCCITPILSADCEDQLATFLNYLKTVSGNQKYDGKNVSLDWVDDNQNISQSIRCDKKECALYSSLKEAELIGLNQALRFGVCSENIRKTLLERAQQEQAKK